jgi:hypothetical protein
MSDDIFRGAGVEVKLPAKAGVDDPKERFRDAFLRIRETLTRIGIPSYKTNSLYQSCHILHKRGHYAILHFKELFQLDGKSTNLTDEDIARRNTVAHMLEEYGLLKVINPEKHSEKIARNFIKIIPFAEKKNWKLLSKYQIGNKEKPTA